MKAGFEITVNKKTYFVVCDFASIFNTKDDHHSNNIKLCISVFSDGKLIKVDKNSYLAEKLCDLIKNSINGQDTIYWNPDGKNRHFDKENK